MIPKKNQEVELRRFAIYTQRTDIAPEFIKKISIALNVLLADIFALYVKTKNFHWHMSGPHFRDYRLLLDEQGERLFAMTDDIAEQVRKSGGTTLRSIGQMARVKRIADNDADDVMPKDMLSELWEDNKALVLYLNSVHDLCDDAGDVHRPVLSKIGSMKLKRGHGFFTKRAEANMANTPTRCCLGFATSPGLRTEGRFVSETTIPQGEPQSRRIRWAGITFYECTINGRSFRRFDMHSGSRGRSRPHGKVNLSEVRRATRVGRPRCSLDGEAAFHPRRKKWGNNMTEAQVVAAAKGGERAAFDELCQTHGTALSHCFANYVQSP